MAKGDEEVPVFGSKEVRINTAIDIHRSNTVVTYNQRDAHNRANAVSHDAFLPLECHIHLCIVSEQRLSRSYHALHSAQADFKCAFVDRTRLLVTCNRKLKFPRQRIDEHEEAALGVHDSDHLVHDQSQYRIEIKC